MKPDWWKTASDDELLAHAIAVSWSVHRRMMQMQWAKYRVTPLWFWAV